MNILVTAPGTPEREFILGIKEAFNLSDEQLKILIICFRSYIEVKSNLSIHRIKLSEEKVEKIKASMNSHGAGIIEVAHDDSEELRKDLEWALKWVDDHPYSSVQEEGLKIKDKWKIGTDLPEPKTPKPLFPERGEGEK